MNPVTAGLEVEETINFCKPKQITAANRLEHLPLELLTSDIYIYRFFRCFLNLGSLYDVNEKNVKFVCPCPKTLKDVDTT